MFKDFSKLPQGYSPTKMATDTIVMTLTKVESEVAHFDYRSRRCQYTMLFQQKKRSHKAVFSWTTYILSDLFPI